MENAPIKNQPILPTYRQMLEEATRQLSARKYLLFRRVAYLLWPIWISIILGYAIKFRMDAQGVPFVFDSPFVFIGIVIWFFFVLFYTFIIGAIIDIEKRVWVDSFFDRKNLSPEASWRIAKKLLVPTIKFSLIILARFYLPAVAIFLSGLLIPWILFEQGRLNAEAFVISFCGGIILMAIYVFMIHVQLRFFWFIFLDDYRKGCSFRTLLTIMSQVNKISRSDTVKRLLITDFASDTLNGLMRVTTTIIRQKLGSFGKVGQAAGALLKITADVMSSQIVSLGRISALYILYRYARKAAFQEEQKVNEWIYGLSK